MSGRTSLHTLHLSSVDSRRNEALATRCVCATSITAALLVVGVCSGGIFVSFGIEGTACGVVFSGAVDRVGFVVTDGVNCGRTFEGAELFCVVSTQLLVARFDVVARISTGAAGGTFYVELNALHKRLRDSVVVFTARTLDDSLWTST